MRTLAKAKRDQLFVLVTLTATLSTVGACAHSLIEGTQIDDTPDTRAVLAVLTELQKSMEARDQAAILRLVSPNYFEDMGTTTESDDFSYDELKAKILPASLAATDKIRVKMEIHDIVIDGHQAHADIRYRARTRLLLPSGNRWESTNDFNRLEFEKSEGRWLVTSGL